MGGLGKTTLAQLVYNDDRVETNFEPKLWVCVSDNFDVKVIVEKIIESATNKKPDQNLELNTLKNHLKDNISEKKYLLVLDDVWNENREKWIGLEDLLMDGAKGSRIIITSRSIRVAKITSKVSPYVLEGLPANESWSLFTQFAFGKGQEPKNPSLVAIGGEIVKKCCGVPLAIRTIGSLLYSEESRDEWVSIKNSELSKITQEETSILPTLKLSYDNLPSHLKHCFAYCRLFPKDHEIDVEMLINLWMGQGFVKSTDTSKSLREIALGYFKDLLWRSFFQEVEEDDFGNATSCKMHDLMHDLAVLVAGMESTTLSSNAEIVHEKTHHVSIDYKFNLYGEKPIATWLKENKIRTFLNIGGSWHSEEKRWSDSNYDVLISNLERLRVLDFGGLMIKTVPQSIGKLKHLRYLNLSWSEIEVLPSSITRLQNLLILDLSWCETLKELPEDIDKLTSLKHLDIDDCKSLTHMPHGLGQLTSLETLTSFFVSKNHPISRHCYGLRLLDKLNNLRELRILWEGDFDYDDVDVGADAMSIEDLQPHPTLKDLYVWGYQGVRSPRWLSSLTNLVNLELVDCSRVKHLPPLDGLSSLQYLSIYRFGDLEYIEVNGFDCPAAAFFPSLKKLKLRNCPNLEGWRMSSTSMTKLPSFPCLSKLEIEDCPKLSWMPLFPSVEGKLKWINLSSKPLQQTMMMMTTTKAASTSSSSPSLPPLSKLTSLDIQNIADLEILPEGLQNLTSLNNLLIFNCQNLISLPEEGFRGLTSLRSLSIGGCGRLKSLSGVFQYLTALKELKITECGELDFTSDGMQWQGLRSLSSLNLSFLPQLVSLPEGLQHLTALKELRISCCYNLTTLTDSMGSLTSLERLPIVHCPKLTSSPEGMRHLIALQEDAIARRVQIGPRLPTSQI